MTRFEVGELVDVAIKGARVVEAATQHLHLKVGGGDLYIAAAMLPSVGITRRAPREWPPVGGDVWKDAEDGRWFCREERGKTWLVPMLARRDARQPDEVLGDSGPLRLVYREGWTPETSPAAAEVEPAGPVDKRAENIAGLRELADWLEAHPGFPIDDSDFRRFVLYTDHPHSGREDAKAAGLADLLRMAEEFGAEVRSSLHVYATFPRFRGGVEVELIVCEAGELYRSQIAAAAAEDLAQAGEVAGPGSPQTGPPTVAKPEHYHSGGAAGGPGGNEAECACGTTYAGFDTHAEAVAALERHIADPAGPVQDWWFTFGHGQPHNNRYVVITGTYDSARDEMVAHFGQVWSHQYESAERAGVDEFGLVELPREEWPLPLVEPAPITDPALEG